jgi:hypothetical protein
MVNLSFKVNNTVRIYQQFCDRNLELKKREDQLQLTIKELETKKVQLQNTITGLEQQLSEPQENNKNNVRPNLEVKQEGALLMNDVLKLQPNNVISYHKNENETLHYSPQAEPSSRALIFDTKDLF